MGCAKRLRASTSNLTRLFTGACLVSGASSGPHQLANLHLPACTRGSSAAAGPGISPSLDSAAPAPQDRKCASWCGAGEAAPALPPRVPRQRHPRWTRVGSGGSYRDTARMQLLTAWCGRGMRAPLGAGLGCGHRTAGSAGARGSGRPPSPPARPLPSLRTAAAARQQRATAGDGSRNCPERKAICGAATCTQSPSRWQLTRARAAIVSASSAGSSRRPRSAAAQSGSRSASSGATHLSSTMRRRGCPMRTKCRGPCKE